MKASTARRGFSGIAIAQRRRQPRLHVEGQPLFRPAQQIMQMHPHIPQKGFRLLEGRVFVAR